MIDILSSALLVSGLFFFLAGSIGLLRLPDLYSRLHALTKADNLGLGLLITGLAMHYAEPLVVLTMLLVWLAVLAASAASAHLIAQHARCRETSS